MRKDIFGRIYNEDVMHFNDDNHEKELQKMDQDRKFDPALYEKGQAWFESGFPLEAASEEMRNNKSFVDGYARGRRLSMINPNRDQGPTRK